MKFNKLFFVLLALTLISMASLVKIRRTEAEAATETDAEAERRKRQIGENEKTKAQCLDANNEYLAGLSENDKLKCKKFKDAAGGDTGEALGGPTGRVGLPKK